MGRYRRLWAWLLVAVLLLSALLPSVGAQELSAEDGPRPAVGVGGVACVFWHPALEGAPSFLETRGIDAAALGLAGRAAIDPKSIAAAFLRSYRSSLALNRSSADWDVQRIDMDQTGVAHVRMKQTFEGIPVLGGEFVVHIEDDRVVAANGRYICNANVAVKPVLSEWAACKAAIGELDLDKPVLQDGELVIFNPALLSVGPDESHLAYRLVIDDAALSNNRPPRSVVALVDALTGKLLFHYDNIQSGRNREVYDLHGSEWLPGTLVHTEDGPVGSPPADAIAAFNFTGATYDYYYDTFGRDSFDDQGATMRCSVRYGTVANAFWNGSQTAFGPGLAAKDVVAHEWTHAVTQYTAGLIYSHQSGSLNESFSDIMGCMVDRDDWSMGEDTPIGVIRSLSHPESLGDPGKVGDYVCTDSDNGGVHTNCTILAHAAYLMAEGGTYNGRTVTGIGRARTEQILYRVLTAYLTASATFRDAYDATISSCNDLYSEEPGVCDSVTTALQAVELDQPIPCGGGVDPDDYEPDDSYSGASWITVNGDVQSHNIHYAGDNDWVKFEASAGGEYVIETFNLGSYCDTYMYLCDTDGSSEIAHDDDAGAGFGSRIAWTATSDGVYFVRVRHYSTGAYGRGTDYDLRVTGTGGGGGGEDEYEPDDVYGQATWITVNGGAQAHNFHDEGDYDWVRFTASEGHNYVIETFNLAARCDTLVHLYDTDGTTLIMQDDDGGGGRASRIAWTAGSGGTYFVRVKHRSSSEYGESTEYDLRVTGRDVSGADDYEPDDVYGEANWITVDAEAQEHNFHVAADQDWVKFDADAGTAYVIETSDLGYRCDTYMYLYHPDGTTEIAHDDDGGDGWGSRITWMAGSGGAYYVRVRPFGLFSLGEGSEYDLSIARSGGGGGDEYEPDDSPAEAGPIAVNGEAQTHNFHVAGDNDWVRFTASAGVEYVIETGNLGGLSDTYLYLYDADGRTEIAHDDDSGDGFASRVTWTAMTGGAYYVRVRHWSSGAGGTGTDYELSVTGAEVGPDDYEDDDGYQQANWITVNGGAQDHNFHQMNDHDWVKFSASTGGEYVIETLDLGARCDTYLYLYGADGSTEIARNDDGGYGLASRIEWRPASDGVYHVLARHYSHDRYGEGTDYSLRVIATADGADEYEPDDRSGEASQIQVNGASQTHNFHEPGDNDWMEFAATAGTTYVIETSNLGSRCDTYAYLYGADGVTQLAHNDDGGTGLGSRIEWRAGASGVHFVRVRHYNMTIHGEGTEYDASIVATGDEGADQYEPDDSWEQAGWIVPDAPPQSHTFHVSGDNDWVKFTASEGITYVFETLSLGDRCDTYLYLYDTDGVTLIARDDDGGPGWASLIEWRATSSGTYYVRARQYWSGVYGDGTGYDLKVSVSGGGDDYEPDDTWEQATTFVVNGSAQSHDFHVEGDNDWVMFSAAPGVRYVIETLNLGSRSDTYMHLYDTDGATEIARDDDSGPGLGSRIEWQAVAAGTYYVRVHAFGFMVHGEGTEYDLRITGAFGPDAFEPDDSYEQASTIAVNGPTQSHNFHVAGDNDWTSFVAVSGTAYSIETSNLGDACDTFLYLYGPDGTTEIAYDDDSGPGLGSRIEWTATTSAACYVRVRHYRNTVSGEGTDYDVRVTGGSGGQVQVLAWIAYTDQDQEYANSLDAISQYHSAYTVVETTTTDASTLAYSLNGKHALLVPEPELADSVTLATLGDRFSTTLNNFVTDGGTVVVLCEWDWYQGFVRHAGLLDARWHDGYAFGASFDVVDPDHPLAEGLGRSITAADAVASYEIGDADADPIAVDGDGYPVVVARDIGDGHVILIGYDYYEYHDDAARVLANAIRWAGQTGPATGAPQAELTSSKEARVGQEIEMIVQVRGAVEGIKIEARAKPAYLELIDAVPLMPDGRIDTAVAKDPERWQIADTSTGAVALRCAITSAEEGPTVSRPVVSLRWRVLGMTPGVDAVRIPCQVTLESSQGCAVKQRLTSSTRLLGSNPKIDGIDPDTITNDRDWQVSINGRDFMETPKVTLRSAANVIQLSEVAFLDARAVSVTVPQGTKIGVYKVQLENPDGGSDQCEGLTVEGKYSVYLPMISR